METLTKIFIIGVVMSIILLVIGGAFVIVKYYVDTNNKLVEQDVAVEKALGNMQSQYQQRADLIPKLLDGVQASAKFEMKTQTEVAGLRSQAISGQQMMQNAKTTEDIQAANNMIDNTLSRLMVVVEAYPTLKSTDAFRDYNAGVEGMEHRINFARDEYNEAVEDYHNTVRKIPSCFVAQYAGFEEDKWKMYKAKEGSDVSPTVTFNI